MIKKGLILFVGALLLFSGAFSSHAESSSVTVISYAGYVKITPPGKAEEVQCRLGMSLDSGTKVRTGVKSYLAIAFDLEKKNLVKIKEQSDVVIRLTGDEKIELVDGTVLALLKNLDKGEKFHIRTPAAVCGARGTGWRTSTTFEHSTLTVFDGKVFTRGIGENGLLLVGEYGTTVGYERWIKKYHNPKKAKKVNKKIIEALKEEMMMLLKANSISQKELKEGKHAILDDDKMSAMDKRMEMVDNRMERFEAMPMGGGAAFGGGRGPKDDDREK